MRLDRPRRAALVVRATILAFPALAAAIAAMPFGSAAAAERAVGAWMITDASAPAALIRGAHVVSAGAGTVLEAGDILATADGAPLQVEAGPGIVIGLGPSTKAWFAGPSRHDAADVVVLSGWVKMQLPRGAAGTTAAWIVDFPQEAVASTSGSYVAHAADQRLEVFVEAGRHAASRLPRAGAGVELPVDRAATWVAERPVQFAERPAVEFVAAMPAGFRSPLYAIGAKVAAVRVDAAAGRPVGYADVAPWLKGAPELRRGLVARFRPRLADDAFRRALDAELGNGPDWKPILHPPPPPATGAAKGSR